MPLSRPVPPYLEQRWHPPTTTTQTVTTRVPYTTTVTSTQTFTVQVPVQRIVDVEVERTRKVRKPIKLTVLEDVEVDEPIEQRSAVPDTGKAEESKEQLQREHNEQTHDVVLDVQDDEEPAPRMSSLSTSSLRQQLSQLSASSCSSSAPAPAPVHRLRAYNPRIVTGYLERQRPGGRKLVSVPSDSLPPPPFHPPTYPLSSIPPPVCPPPVFSTPSSSASSAVPTLTITIPPASSSSPPAPARPDSEFSDPTTLDGAGISLRDNVAMPRGSPRHLLQGVRITGVAPGSRADRAGLRAGDEVLSVHGREVRCEEDMVVVVNRIPGALRVVVRRDDGDVITLTL